MKLYALIFAFGGLVGAAAVAQAQTAPPPKGALENLQDDFGAVLGAGFHLPDPIINAPAANAPDAPGPVLGRALRTSQEIPGAVFAAFFKPFADAEAPPAPAPAPAAPAPRRHHRHAGGYHRVSSATSG